DMGGTTAKCAIVERGLVQTTDEYHVDGRPLRIPVIDIKEVSAGGGTIAWIDAGGALTLGPHSAGADPGPVCYARGGQEPTVTDANLVLGRIDAGRFLGGAMPLDLARAVRAIDGKIGAALGLTRAAAAAGIVRLADVKMALAVRSITTERGLDPRDYTLLTYGGGGPPHAVAIARELGTSRVVVPRSPSPYSASEVPVPLLTLRPAVVFPLDQPRLPTLDRRTSGTPAFETRKIYSSLAGDSIEYRVYQREALRPGDQLNGPAAIEEPGTTTIIDAADTLSIENHGCLIIHVNAAGAMGGIGGSEHRSP